MTPEVPVYCGEIVKGDPRSRNGDNQWTPCTRPARAHVVLRVKSGELVHTCCGIHQRALEKSSLYLRTEPMTSSHLLPLPPRPAAR